jgi:hypothetical protein
MSELPVFDILYKNTDDDAVPGMKTLYIVNLSTGEIVTHRYELPKPINSFNDQECRILNSRSREGYVNAYPNYITMEEIQILFPNCTALELRSPVDLSELSGFFKLQNLILRSSDQKNINGIEFLSSLQYLLLDLKVKSTPPHFPPTLLKDLSLLNSLDLKYLSINSDCIEDLGYLNIETLVCLYLNCKSLKSLKGMKVPNLKEMSIKMSQYDLLLSFDIPDGCNIYLSGEDNINNSATITSIHKIVKKILPQCHVEITF